MPDYRCTRNALYSHQCLGREDLSVREGHFITAENEEEAWQKMALRYPKEVDAGFTVQEWESFDVTVIEVRDEDG